MAKEKIILVWREDGKFFQWYKNINNGIGVAREIKGSYRIIEDEEQE